MSMSMSDDLHDLPQKGLPTVLNLLLKQLLNNNDINSWSIYENKVGIINLNIRFSVQVDDNAASQCIVDMPATYRKVGQKQVDVAGLEHNNTTKHWQCHLAKLGVKPGLILPWIVLNIHGNTVILFRTYQIQI